MLELEHGFRVVDVHARLEPDESRRPRDGIGDPEQLEREMHQAGVVRALVYPGDRDGSYLKANNAVARMSVGRPLVAFARINGARESGDDAGSRLKNLTARRGDDHTSPGDVEQYAYDDRFHGFVLAPGRDGLPEDDVLNEIENADAPVIVRGGVDFPPRTVAATLLDREFPVVLASFGGRRLDRALMDSAIDLLDEYDQLHLDTSFVRYRSHLERGLLEHPDRICFGSGSPAVHPNVGVMELLTLDVPEDVMRRAFSKNPARVVSALAPGDT